MHKIDIIGPSIKVLERKNIEILVNNICRIYDEVFDVGVLKGYCLKVECVNGKNFFSYNIQCETFDKKSDGGGTILTNIALSDYFNEDLFRSDDFEVKLNRYKEYLVQSVFSTAPSECILNISETFKFNFNQPLLNEPQFEII